MKGIKHIFLRECRNAGVAIKIGPRWQCRWKELEVPSQKTKVDLFYGFHELGHYWIHRQDKRDYDDLRMRIDIEIEADEWANNKMKEYGFNTFINNGTLGLIALYLYEGNEMSPYSICVSDRFITLYKKIDNRHYEVLCTFVSQLPMHPTTY